MPGRSDAQIRIQKELECHTMRLSCAVESARVLGWIVEKGSWGDDSKGGCSTWRLSDCSSGRVIDTGKRHINPQFGGGHCIPPQQLVTCGRHSVHYGGLPILTGFATIRNKSSCHAWGDWPEVERSSSSGLTAAYVG